MEGDAHRSPRDPGLEWVLVVENEPELLNLAASLFRSIGYDVHTADNGADAVRILDREREVDILFTDIVMPNMSGVELPRWANEHHPGLKLVLTSGYPRPAQAEQHGGTDRYAFVNKPYRLTELAKVLRSI